MSVRHPVSGRAGSLLQRHHQLRQAGAGAGIAVGEDEGDAVRGAAQREDVQFFHAGDGQAPAALRQFRWQVGVGQAAEVAYFHQFGAPLPAVGVAQQDAGLRWCQARFEAAFKVRQLLALEARAAGGVAR